MKTWLKGGLIGISALIILVLLWGSVSAIINSGECGFWDSPPSLGLCYGVPYMVLTLPTFYAGSIAAHAFYSQTSVGEPIPTALSSSVGFFFTVIGGFLMWFLAGAVIGLVVQKIKYKK